MSGRSKSCLVEGDDGLRYVAKFKGNPEGYRTLVNELISSQLIQLLGVTTPTIRLLYLPETVQARDGLPFKLGFGTPLLKLDLHLGSQCPVDPEKIAIFDFMPRKLLPKVSNIEDFATMLVIDLWLSNLDVRQTIFVRNSAGRFQASFIDHGMCFGGTQWKLGEAPRAIAMAVFQLLDMKRLAEAAAFRIQCISAESLRNTIRSVPAQWLMPGDEECLEILLTQLHGRQAELNNLVRRRLVVLGLN